MSNFDGLHLLRIAKVGPRVIKVKPNFNQAFLFKVCLGPCGHLAAMKRTSFNELTHACECARTRLCRAVCYAAQLSACLKTLSSAVKSVDLTYTSLGVTHSALTNSLMQFGLFEVKCEG